MDSTIAHIKHLASDKILLIVEDDETVSKTLGRLLSRFFKGIRFASNVPDALKVYEEIKNGMSPLLIITDINLGSQSGIDLSCHIKKLDPSQKLIAISGTEERSVYIELIRCGVDRFILKPINQNDLFETLVTILTKIDYDLELKRNQILLENSREYAHRLLKEQDQFLKNAIHEIHTPLAVIITNIDLLRMNGDDNESLKAIEAASRIIQNSYEDMTYLMKHNRITDQRSTIDLAEFIAERKRYFTCIAEVNELSLSMRIGQSNLPKIIFSEAKLSRLVDNTLSNAIKYSNRSTDISIIVGMRKGTLFFEVRNHGPLIKDKKKIFERFHRESEHGGGYGLGLNIVAQICDEEGIDIELSSTPVRGNSFRYFFKNGTLLQHISSTIPYQNATGVLP